MRDPDLYCLSHFTISKAGTAGDTISMFKIGKVAVYIYISWIISQFQWFDWQLYQQSVGRLYLLRNYKFFISIIRSTCTNSPCISIQYGHMYDILFSTIAQTRMLFHYSYSHTWEPKCLEMSDQCEFNNYVFESCSWNHDIKFNQVLNNIISLS